MTRSDVHFDESLVGPALDTLDVQLAELDNAWYGAPAAIRAGESGFGPPDLLNQAFHPGYAPRAERLRPEAERRLTQYRDLIAAGRDSVEIYRRGDHNGALVFTEIN
ncbi:hypothetical protein [Saccharothrix luteola]|uniref:hypothetical protein n=1 Tax=Saccharothrix luteola TaxID=2893018 RepID=UPI001E393273|nr:hypothetical protein [Saccharothrix luteola]MCC8246416.1 hypothetical protein [Saccharothrix luteola]